MGKALASLAVVSAVAAVAAATAAAADEVSTNWAGYAIADVLNRYRIIHIPGDVYQITYVPFKILPFDFAMVIAAAVLICFVATIYPSRQAARLDPAQALRYE